MNDLWLFVEHGSVNTWTRAMIPNGVNSVMDMIRYLKHGGPLDVYKLTMPAHARYSARSIGQTVIARLEA